MQHVDDDAYRLALGLATMHLAIQLTEREADDRRRDRKVAVVTEKWDVLRRTFPVELDALQGYGGTGPSIRQLADAYRNAIELWPTAHRRLLLIDVVMGDPFAPYELKVPVDDAVAAIRELAEPTGLDAGDLDTAWRVWSDALVAYRPSRWRRPNTKVKQIPALAADDFVLPPAPGQTPQETDGDGDGDDAGAPELSEHHLALISGGSLSGAEPDLAGGLWLGEIEPAAGSAADNERVRRLLSLPLAQARTELVKLAMAHALVVRPGHVTTTTTTTVLGALGQLHLVVDDQLEVEQERNDDDAPRIRTLEELLRAVDVARAHVERVRDGDEALLAEEEAAREAAGDLPPIAGSPEPPDELAPDVDAAPPVDDGPAATGVDATGTAPTPLGDPAPDASGSAPGGRGGAHEAGTPGRAPQPTGALDGELVLDFLEAPAEGTSATSHRHPASTNLVAAVVADVMAMGITDIADTPVDEEPELSPAAAEAFDANAPNPLRAPVAAANAAGTDGGGDAPADGGDARADGGTSDSAPTDDAGPALTARRPERGAA